MKKVLAIFTSFILVTSALCILVLCGFLYISFGPNTLEISSDLFKKGESSYVSHSVHKKIQEEGRPSGGG